jgi:hypothetical protein
MSALGQKQTFAAQKAMSALPQKRTYAVQTGMSAKGHKRTHAAQQLGSLLDHLVGARAKKFTSSSTPVAFADLRLMTS